MEKGYRNIYFLFIIILTLVPIGFRRYFQLFPTFNEVPSVVHFHSVIMLLWCITLVVQPILINRKKYHIHRLVGKMSYLLAPMVIVSMWLIIDYSFIRMNPVLSREENLAQIFFPISQMILFILFYILAMVYKNKAPIHMRYIIMSSIVLLGPTIGRIDFSILGLGSFNMDLIVMDLVILLLFTKDVLNKRDYKPYGVGLVAYLGLHIVYHYIPQTEFWMNLAGFIF
jgi:hypothetical protein